MFEQEETTNEPGTQVGLGLSVSQARKIMDCMTEDIRLSTLLATYSGFALSFMEHCHRAPVGEELQTVVGIGSDAALGYQELPELDNAEDPTPIHSVLMSRARSYRHDTA